MLRNWLQEHLRADLIELASRPDSRRTHDPRSRTQGRPDEPLVGIEDPRAPG